MFEQALLTTGHEAGKKRAVAVAFTGQAACVGAAVLASMFYAEKLSAPRWVQIVAPPLMREQPVEIKTKVAAGSSAAHAQSAQPVFQAPVAAHRHYVPDMGAPELTPPTELFAGHGPVGVPGPVSNVISEALPDAPPATPPVTVQKKQTKPVPVGGDVAAAMLVHKVLPVYPALAKQMRLSGTVELLGVIGKDGRIQQLQVVSGHPLLVGAALDAVKQWLYRPTLLNGEPVEVSAPIQVRFVLGG